MTHCGCSSGISAIGDLEWGSHLCHLYQTPDDLVDTVVPFLAAGLESNEQCLWVTSEPEQTERVTRELAQRVPDLQTKIERGQVRIVAQADWYGRTGTFDVDSLLAPWVAAEQAAREGGYAGVRALGHHSFINNRADWRQFRELEARVNAMLAGRRMIALCSYDLGMLDAGDLLDLLSHHQFAVVGRDGQCERLEKARKRAAQDTPLPPSPGGEELLRTRIAELERALRAQELEGRAKDDFMAMLGHELRNPLAPMMTAIQLMRLRGNESREQEILDRQVNHLARLVDDLLDISRIARGQIELRKRPVELSQIVIRAIEVASPLVEQRQQRLDIQVPRDGLLIDADLERMAQVLGNLLTNASKYSEPRSRILVSARRDGTNIQCSVKDEGIGIAPAMLDSVFDPFVQQPDTLEQSRGGLGLGLAIVRSLVTQHGGTVRAQSDGPGRGSEFIIELPAVVSPGGSG